MAYAKVKGSFCICIPLLSVQLEPRVLSSPPNMYGTFCYFVLPTVKGMFGLLRSSLSLCLTLLRSLEKDELIETPD